MAVELVTFVPPFPIDITGDINEQLAEKLGSGEGYTDRTLPSGEYDLTPPADTYFRHNLVVFPEGNGVLRLVAPDNHVETSLSDGQTRTPLRRGGTQFRLPEDAPTHAIASGIPGQKGRQAVYHVIFHVPGPSPR